MRSSVIWEVLGVVAAKCSMHVLLGVGPGIIPGHAVPPNELEEVAGEKEVWASLQIAVPVTQTGMSGKNQ